MKLRNKKTGEISDFAFVKANSSIDDYTLADLTEEWEDYEEPHYCCWIDSREERIVQADVDINDECCDWQREHGLAFTTEEEAEQMLERLKAWKRLKDKGFHISGWCNNIGDDYYKPSQIVIELDGPQGWDEYDDIEPFEKDLDSLFGGRE